MPDRPDTAPQATVVDLPDDEDLLRLDLQICFALHAASRAFGGVYRQVLRDTGLTYPQYLAMMVLWEHGEMPVKRLGDFLRLDSGTLSPLLKRLETAGLVQRERSVHDERSVTVRPTADGAALKRTAQAVPRKVIGATGLDAAEMTELRSRLRHLTMALDAALDDLDETEG
ncbi:MarR family winged helix-turn-helix transcriptional regulator [Streptomyces sp. SAJ15]|uniref:MarR family winged helix-turn-helix transcriptional regulator n=1 Tax=Streptomyces sp. SAJ15 TaxID=2011095 RepID=UPI00118492C4|nr:MarR family transcriptional regulator [Streptomyces sp. SAJ15]TVL90601.1 MarR family transcriptional regulator [Streptomyces sp. SAJ15]